MVTQIFSHLSPGEVWKAAFDDTNQCLKVILSAALIAGGQEVIISALDDSIKIGDANGRFLVLTTNNEAKTHDTDVIAALASILAALASVPVTGPLTDIQLRATAVPVSASSLPLPAGAATSGKQDTMIASLQALNSLTPSTFDFISMSYTGTDLTGVVFKTGGSGGTTISTLTLAYSSSVLQSVTRT